MANGAQGIGSSGLGGSNGGDGTDKITQATKRLENIIVEATVRQLDSAAKILPRKAEQSAVQGLPKQ